MATPGVGGSLSAASDVSLNNPSDGQVLKRDNGFWKNLADSTAGGGSGGRVGLVVAANNAPTSLKSSADFVCSGTNDEVQINTAITQAAYSDNGGDNWGLVALSGGEFRIQTPIKMRTGVHLQGSGSMTILKSIGMASNRAVVELSDIDTHLTRITDLTIDGNYAQGGGSSGIWYRNSTGGFNTPKATAGNYDSTPGSSPDSCHLINDLYIKGFAGAADRHGVFLDADCRGPWVSQVRVGNCSGSGFKMNASSDGKYYGSTAIGCAIGWEVGGGSNMFTTCKSAYSTGDGWQLSSSRAQLVGCHAQDNGRHGFSLSSVDIAMSGCVSDSNRRLDASGYAIKISGDRAVVEGIHIYDRGQSSQVQTNGIDFTGSNNIYLTGFVGLPSGTNHANGTPGGSSYVRVLRLGSSTLSIG